MNVALIPQKGIRLHLGSDCRVLREYLILHELFSQRKGRHFLQNQVEELAFFVVYYVVVADKKVTMEFLCYFVLLSGDAIRDEAVPHSNAPLSYKIHLRHLILLIVDDLVLFSGIVLPWHQSKGHIIQKIGLFVLLRVKKRPEFLENIFEKVLSYHLPLS